jgi:hypothetical protein
MLLSIFRLNYAFINLLLGLLLAGLWSIPFIQKISYQFHSQNVIGIDFDQIDYTISAILGFLSTLIMASLINNLFNKSNLSSKTSSIPGLLFAIFMLYDPNNFFFQGEHVFYICFLLGLLLMSNINRNYLSMETTFLFGILIGIGTLFLNVGVFALLTPWVFLSILRPFVWREYLAAFFGFFLVGCVTASVQLFKHTGSLHLSPNNLEGHLMPYESGATELTFVIAFFFGLIILSGLRAYLKKVGTSVLRWKKMTRVLLISVILLIIICGLNDLQFYNNTVFFPIAILCSLIGTFYLQDPKREWLQILLFHGYLGLMVVNHFV